VSEDITTRLRRDCMSLIADEAADEIERLRKERDEARRSCCEFAAMVDSADTVVMYVDSNRFHEIAMKYMKSRGWDCFPQEDGK
jgi:hypothetical protein